MNPAQVGVVLLITSSAPQAYSAFLPSIMTIRTFVDDDKAVRDIREGEIFGSAFVLLIGTAGAMLTNSNAPFLISLATIVVMVAIYEYALRGRHAETNMAEQGSGN